MALRIHSDTISVEKTWEIKWKKNHLNTQKQAQFFEY